ncbi:MAG: c-type cytochrome [Rhodocyclaceae bacterium]|nr:MAG: c-type cytochrome [Rhodocyclaceae bacterium]
MKTSLLLSALLAFCLAPTAQASEALASKSGCMACHTKDKKLVGPAFRDVSAKYKDQKDAEAKLIDKVRKGGSGNWGPIPMSPNGPEKISDGDLKTVVEWILKGAA